MYVNCQGALAIKIWPGIFILKNCEVHQNQKNGTKQPNGYILSAYREGKQHCQNGMVEFLLETIRLCKRLTDQPLLVRLDSGNDSIDNVAVLIDAGCYFIIKRNLRRESKDGWFDMAKQYCKNITTPREGKTVYVGSDWKDVHSKV